VSTLAFEPGQCVIVRATGREAEGMARDTAMRLAARLEAAAKEGTDGPAT